MKFPIALIVLFLSSNCPELRSQEITMFPGFWRMKYYEDDKQISRKEVETLMLQDDEANRLWQKSKKHMSFAVLGLGAQLGFLFWQLDRSNNRESQTAPFIGVLGSAAVSIGFYVSSNNLKKKAILKYNNSVDVGTLNIGPTYNGLGWSGHFEQ